MRINPKTLAHTLIRLLIVIQSAAKRHTRSASILITTVIITAQQARTMDERT